MGESYEERQKRLKLQREKDQKRKNKAERKEAKRQQGLWGFKDKESLGQTLALVPAVPGPFQQAFQSLVQAYFSAMWQQMGRVLPYVPQGTPKQVPLNWPEYFGRVLRDDHVRASSAVNFFGICQQKTLLERVEEKTKFFRLERKAEALRHGSAMHKRLEDVERQLVEGYAHQGYSVSFDRESLKGYDGLAFVQEQSFEGEFDVSRRVRVTGHPDRVVGTPQMVYVLEAKTNVHKFSPQLVIGACVQSLLYGLLVERFAGRQVTFALTESTLPLERKELDALFAGDDAGFVERLGSSGKARVLVPFDAQHKQMALYFLDQMVSVWQDPRRASGAKKEVCDRYVCPFRNRGCATYQGF